jgi:AraC family transcriptional regulator
MVYEQALATILQLVLPHTGSPATTTEAPLAHHPRGRFTAATEFVEEHLDRKIRLNELASLVALSVSQFAHAFKAEYGVSPHRYLTVRRIERAKALLRTTDDTVASIAQRAGFASQAHFSESFGKVVGVTPTAYRHAA